MFETGMRQLRVALSMAFGRPINPRNLERLIGDALKTLDTFGTAGDDVEMLLDGPFADPEVRRGFQEQALRRTAHRLAKRSPFYRERFAALGLDARTLPIDAMPDVPVTSKLELIEQPARFIVDGGRPYLATRTTGTTGRPVEVWLSRYEMELWPAMSALSAVIRGELRSDDYLQVNISSRASVAVALNTATMRVIGARSRQLGLVAPDESIDSLIDGGDEAPTMLSTYPSYLAQLVRAARRRGLGPESFRLRSIACGGEVLSPALEQAAGETFGARIQDAFGMTEVLPVSGRVCEHGHLHHDHSMGFVEVIDADSGRPCGPGEIGTVVITPYYPYRECMPVFRYDTRDLVRPLDQSTLTCSLAGTPASTRILGKAGHVINVGARTVTPRELVEAFERLPGEPWPARFSAEASGDGLVVRIGRDTSGPLTADDLERRLTAELGGLPVAFQLVDAESATGLRHLRADLREHTFTVQGA